MQTPVEFLKSCVARHRRLLLTSSVLALVGSLVGLIYPWLAGTIAQRLLGQSAAALGLSVAFAGLVGLIVLQSTIALTGQWVFARSYTRASFELRTRVYDHLQWLALEQHQ